MRDFPTWDDFEQGCLECGLKDFRESEIPGVCVDCLIDSIGDHPVREGLLSK